jgi:predicted nucleic-acid-binding protein
MIPLLDTNIVLRFLTSDKGKKYERLYEFFLSLERGDMRVELKLIVLFQIIFVLKSYYSVSKQEIVHGIQGLLEYKGITIKEKKIVQRTLELWSMKNVEIVDCYLIACLERDTQHVLYSYDRDFNQFNINRKEP